MSYRFCLSYTVKAGVDNSAVLKNLSCFMDPDSLRLVNILCLLSKASLESAVCLKSFSEF